jgi:hypothetical protein
VQTALNVSRWKTIHANGSQRLALENIQRIEMPNGSFEHDVGELCGRIIVAVAVAVHTRRNVLCVCA